MPNAQFQYSEDFLQWIWENHLFDFTSLQTSCGKSVHIHDVGRRNSSDGPDFNYAKIEIDGITWNGDVEIHTQSSNWNNHGHQHDPNFNTVFLHVIASEGGKPVYTENGSRPFTLNLLSYLSSELHHFLINFTKPVKLPCSSSINFISEDAFYQQLEKAHREYFEKKANDFLKFYDPEILPSKAWKKALIISVWDGLGISQNRTPMQQTGTRLLEQWNGESPDEGIRLALEIAGINDASSSIHWNFKSVRPANHPKARIKEAVCITHQILQQSFDHFLQPSSLQIWDNWMKTVSLSRSSRMRILFGTVYLPSLYVMGNLFASTSLTNAVLSKWKALKTPIPSSLTSAFNSLGLSDSGFRKKLGAVHQLKTYCNNRNCSECLVLKKAIQS